MQFFVYFVNAYVEAAQKLLSFEDYYRIVNGR